MKSTNYSKELKIAVSAVKASEKTFRKYFGTKTKVEIKNNNYRDLVSFADKKIEREIKAVLHKAFPHYGFVGEEGSNVNSDAKMVWILDAIDGTTNYLQGSIDCAISLVLQKAGRSVLGVVYAPLRNQLYSATAKGGAFLNGKRIKVSRVTEIKYGYGSFGWEKNLKFAVTKFPKILQEVKNIRICGSGAISLCQVAEGVFDFHVGHDLKIWDYAAAQVILEEAGGELILSAHPKMQIAANKVLAAKLFHLFK
ncbi:MAG: hypothetical protein A3A83_00055 [Candidatus Doudnabacteria bacterium RIFCSPLOWO2_01_FULL_48_57]|uniref:Inositol-phosphate phosphatase n=1 Tax=Candidatus Doudnabacteria bacterium RIFCSPLOWO2_02_FULL_48_13 TaxID=1817845 RepID=A0A1F5Q8Y5_9BACT|nr:MAG: hypothetical protein A3K05_01575 [Candidatus Doudnabacteria bacterium RIFCSPHIGHO2_01_48_18]OGE77059.1 MAG: hypothetical protein A2668_02990 [Candidatus Doudnabacteria bacterium RIFCSPHIGHO2_01_FULL_48_180]OGE90987.1 MAG: hypothetical protein A3F44_01045 [Candidatus Doudnabacteria bacterium RIFCSPHIGHO2_12_FULL_47_25]OGE96349.1 MAG: hypothetical protein A3A83_00055 [Candidatus Doudnabacteria bacterium RIFCSPLOWO2_01_FULL_48_57]OGE98588.1 MAG: hypothetical protein A3J05_01225 [Candidatus